MIYPSKRLSQTDLDILRILEEDQKTLKAGTEHSDPVPEEPDDDYLDELNEIEGSYLPDKDETFYDAEIKTNRVRLSDGAPEICGRLTFDNQLRRVLFVRDDLCIIRDVPDGTVFYIEDPVERVWERGELETVWKGTRHLKGAGLVDDEMIGVRARYILQPGETIKGLLENARYIALTGEFEIIR